MNLTAGQARNSNQVNPSSSVYFLSLTGKVLRNSSAWVFSCPNIPRILSVASVVALGFSAGNKNLTGKVVRIARALVAPDRQWGMSLAKFQKTVSVLTETVDYGEMAPVTRCH